MQNICKEMEVILCQDLEDTAEPAADGADTVVAPVADTADLAADTADTDHLWEDTADTVDTDRLLCITTVHTIWAAGVCTDLIPAVAAAVV